MRAAVIATGGELIPALMTTYNEESKGIHYLNVREAFVLAMAND